MDAIFPMLEHLPLELFLQVASQLDFTSYLNLRRVCVFTSTLDPIPTLSFHQYQQMSAYFQGLTGQGAWKSWKMRLKNSSIHDDSFLFLIKHFHGSELLRIVPHLERISPAIKQKGFEALLNDEIFDTGKPILDLFRFIREERTFKPWRYMTTREHHSIVQDAALMRIKILFALLDHVDPQVYAVKLSRESARVGHLECLITCIERFNPEIPPECLTLAAENDYLDMYLFLVKRLDPTYHDQECLVKACKYGHLKTVKTMLKDKRLDVKLNNFHCLKLVLEEGHEDLAKYLVKFGVDRSCLRLAQKFGLDDIAVAIKKKTV